MLVQKFEDQESQYIIALASWPHLKTRFGLWPELEKWYKRNRIEIISYNDLKYLLFCFKTYVNKIQYMYDTVYSGMM